MIYTNCVAPLPLRPIRGYPHPVTSLPRPLAISPLPFLPLSLTILVIVLASRRPPHTKTIVLNPIEQLSRVVCFVVSGTLRPSEIAPATAKESSELRRL